MNIINKTPHAIYILREDGTIFKNFPRSRGMIRVSEDTKKLGSIDGIPITSTAFGETPDVPEQLEGTFYIVSQLVQSALPNRTDLLVPRGIVRDNAGNILGCTALDLGSNTSKNILKLLNP